MSYEPRIYRKEVDAADLIGFEVVFAETDLRVSAESDLTSQANALVRELRGELEEYIAANPRFAESHVPVPVTLVSPAIVRAMADAAQIAGVGPMAAVAGAFAEAVARGLQPASSSVIVENGGDLYLIGGRERRVLVGAGDSPLSERIALVVFKRGVAGLIAREIDHHIRGDVFVDVHVHVQFGAAHAERAEIA